MIFRLNGGVENLLALTPVLVEWRRRCSEPVFVETHIPEVFRMNPYVDEASFSVKRRDSFIDLNLVPWAKMISNVTETYATRVLGDCRMSSWRTTMAASASDRAEASRRRPKGDKVAAYFADSNEFSTDMDVRMRRMMESRGYSVMDLTGLSLGATKAAIDSSSVFVGTDGAVSSVAFTTDVPAVVCYTWRDPCYFAPFRRGAPFEALVLNENVCDVGKVCLAKNGWSELGQVYGHRCPKERKFACREMPFDEMASEALDKMEARA